MFLTAILLSVSEWTRHSPRPEACGKFRLSHDVDVTTPDVCERKPGIPFIKGRK